MTNHSANATDDGGLPMVNQLPTLNSELYQTEEFKTQRAVLGYSSELPAIVDIGTPVEIGQLPQPAHTDIGAAPIATAAPAPTTQQYSYDSVAAEPSSIALPTFQSTPAIKSGQGYIVEQTIAGNPYYFNRPTFDRKDNYSTRSTYEAETSNLDITESGGYPTVPVTRGVRFSALPEQAELDRLADLPNAWPHLYTVISGKPTVQAIESGRSLGGVGDRVIADFSRYPTGTVLRTYVTEGNSEVSVPTAEIVVQRTGPDGVAQITRAHREIRIGDHILSTLEVSMLSNLSQQANIASAQIVETPGSVIGAIPGGLVYINSNAFSVGDILQFSDDRADRYARDSVSDIQIVSVDGRYSVGRVLSATRPVEVGFELAMN
ncbi:MAG: hypothetical protein HWE20_06085 [Gammaproteobacteria bacterium]|nr:hypothetical protein [Gammaproteobacteria bacterium]